MTSRRGFRLVVATLLFVTATGTQIVGASPSTNAILGQGNRLGLERDLGFLASDATQGRDNDTPGSTLAQNYLIGELKHFAVGANTSATSDDAFKQPMPGGTNIVAMIPGGAPANEYVLVGAHYDHLGNGCRSSDPNDDICNGATDNAAGVANVLSIGREIAQRPGAPRRTVILAFWDREEDGLLGSAFYVRNPLVQLAQTVGYVNYDIQGANLLPSLERDTFAIGAETGGARLQSLVRSSAQHGPLDTHSLSAIFGENRSDYVNLIGAGVPTVFYSDATGPCYHTAQDDIRAVDFWKLGFEARMGLETVEGLVDGARPSFSGSNPLATYGDAVALQPAVNKAMADIGRFSVSDRSTLVQFRADVNRIVAEGPANFDSADVGAMLGEAAAVVQILNSGPCAGFQKPGN
jgi:hypothetical protein